MGIGAMAQGKKEKAPQVPMYEVKSGIVTMEMDMMGRKIVQEIYFDDYGTKQAMKMDFQGQKVRAVEVDGEYIMIDEASMTGTKMPAMGMGSNEKINFLDKSEKNIRKNKIKHDRELIQKYMDYNDQLLRNIASGRPIDKGISTILDAKTYMDFVTKSISKKNYGGK